MLKKTITYTNADGNEITEDFHFNLTKAELLKMELSETGGFKEHLEQIVKSGNGKDIIEAFEQILRAAYGVRTPDGKFVKIPGAFDEFVTTEAYSEMFFELVTDAKKSSEFVNAIVPAALIDEVKKAQDVQLPKKDYTQMGTMELMELSREELLEAMRQKNQV